MEAQSRPNGDTISAQEELRYAELQAMALDFARADETDSLQKMIEAGLPVNLTDAKGNSLLMLASYHGNQETTRMLLAHQAEVDRRNDRGQTPLGGVAFKGYAEIVILLLEHGAEIDANNGAGMTPMMIAAMFGRKQVVDQLLRFGASPKKRNRFGLSTRFFLLLSRWLSLLGGQPKVGR